MPRRQNFVTYYSPGTLFPEFTTKPIESWDPAMAVKMSRDIIERHNARPYGFIFSTRIVADDVPDGAGSKLKVQSKEVERSEMYFITGTVLTFDELEARAKASGDNNDARVVENARGDIAVIIDNRNSFRSTHEFGEKNVVVDDAGRIVERGDDPKRVAYRAEMKKRWEVQYK